MHERYAQCWIEWKSIFWFLFSELWLIEFTIYWWRTLLSKSVNYQKKKDSFKSYQTYIKYGQWVETNGKSIFQYLRHLFFEFIRFSTFCIYYLDMTTWKIRLSKNVIFIWLKKMVGLHNPHRGCAPGGCVRRGLHGMLLDWHPSLTG